MNSEKTADLIGGIVAVTVCVIAYILTFRAKDPRHDANYQNKSNSNLINQFRRIIPSPFILAFIFGITGLIAGLILYFNLLDNSRLTKILVATVFGFIMLAGTVLRFSIVVSNDWDFYRVRPFFAILGIILILILIAAFFISGYEIALDKH